MDSYELGAWFCSHGCYNMARLFSGSDNGTLNQQMKHNLINTYNNCYTKLGKDGELIHLPRVNAEKVAHEVREGKIFIVKGVYEKTTDDNHFGKYD